MALDFSDRIEEVSKNITSMEQVLGKTLMQPFSGANAGARKLMFSTHKDHVFPLLYGEKATIETGYEIRFGDYSSSITRADSDYVVIDKISKYSFAPNHHYWLILRDVNKKKLDVIERISYHHITESYGYLYNNEYMDNLEINDIIPNRTIVQKSLAFDEYNNRRDGCNFNVLYMALDDNMEDSIIFSDVAAAKLTSPLIKPVPIMINDNDIPLNIYGDDKKYKVIPDIGEEIKDGNLIVLRKEKKEEAFFAQSVDRLRKPMMSDDKKKVHGRVIDVNIYCNNPEKLDSHYYSQFKMYYDELQRYSSHIVKTLLPYVSEEYEMTYELQKLFAEAKRVCNHDQYTDKRPFSFIRLDITVLEEKLIEAGDKASNRFGGKGIISNIWKQEMMPRYKDPFGNYVYADVIFNSSTMYGRENVGQLFEITLNFIGTMIIYKIKETRCSIEEAYAMIKLFVHHCSPEQEDAMQKMVETMNRDELIFFMESIINSEYQAIDLSMKPISDVMTIDKIAEIYDDFPWIDQIPIEVALESSNGTIRHIPARRKVVIGKQYIFRLKQFAEEKFSATSLSATNIRNENSKSRARKDFRELYPNTPIRFGNMETNNFNHIGADAVIANLMIHSISPQARRLVEQMYTGDPFDIDIKLDSDSKNRSAEIANTYLKTIGRRLRFVKRRKVKQKILISPITFKNDPVTHPISFVPENLREGYDYEKSFKERQELEEQKKANNAESPLLFRGITRK